MRHKQPEIIQISRNSAGFCVTSNSTEEVLQARLHRAGAVWLDSLSLEFDSYLKKGKKFTFVLPEEFWAFNVGYYDVDIFSNGKLLKTVRLQYLCADEAVDAEHVELEVQCKDRDPANPDPVVDCSPAPCDVPDFCDQDYTLTSPCNGDAASDSTAAPKILINSASVTTNEDLVRYVDNLVIELDRMLDAGFYFNSAVVLDSDMRESIQELKSTLADLQNTEVEQAISPVIAMQAELQALSATISRNMANSSKVAMKPPTPAIKPNPEKRIVKSPQQVLADKFEEVFQNGKS